MAARARVSRRVRRRRRAVAVGGVALLLAGGWLAARQLGGGSVVVSQRCTATVEGTGYELAPEQAGNAATVTAIALRRGLPARAATIGIATAVQESGLRVIDYGDRDSLGLFQQRPSQGWGSPEQVMDPVYATNAFYDVLTEVQDFQGLEVTDAAQRVQRSGFPTAYADHEPEGRAYASALTGYSPAALACRLRPPTAAGDVAEVAALLQRDLGDTGARAVEGEPGVLRVPVADGDAGARRGWAVAHWAVAQAQRLDLVAVGTAGRQWRRDRPGEGWHADGTDAAGSDEVLIEVASG